VFGHQGDIAGWRAEAERGVSLDPNNAWVLSGLASYYAFQGSAAEALSAIQKLMRASPHDPMTWLWMLWITIAKYFAGDYEGTLEAAQRLIRFRPEVPMAYRWRAAALGQLGRINEAREALQEAIEASPTNFYGNVRMRHPYMRPDRYEHMLEGLRKAGLPE
jgi:adenylate cyclase